ncbi:MAG TPA: hypothetical protein VGH36_07935 [Acetobacteraceae bacterium]|jgi:hypothetical protein
MKNIIFTTIAVFGIAAAVPAFAASVATVNSSRIAPTTVTLASAGAHEGDVNAPGQIAMAGANEGGLNGGDPHQAG